MSIGLGVSIINIMRIIAQYRTPEIEKELALADRAS
jgi:hypothetical protein